MEKSTFKFKPFVALVVNQEETTSVVRENLMSLFRITYPGMEMDKFYSVVKYGIDSLVPFKRWIKGGEYTLEMTQIGTHPEGCIALQGTVKEVENWTVRVIIWQSKYFNPQKLEDIPCWFEPKVPIIWRASFQFFDGTNWVSDQSELKNLSSGFKEFSPLEKAIYAIKKFNALPSQRVKTITSDEDGELYVSNTFQLREGVEMVNAMDQLISDDARCVPTDICRKIAKATGCDIFAGERDSFGWLSGVVQTKHGRIVFG